MKSKTKEKPGPKPIVWDEEQAKLVCLLAEHGVAQSRIAAALGLSESTLKRHYGPVLKLGHARALATFEMNFYQLAKSGLHPSISIFWAKCRLAYNENKPDAPKPKKRAFVFRVTGPGERIDSPEVVEDEDDDE